MIKVSLAEAKNKLTELVWEAEAGKEVMILKHRKPAVRLISEEKYQRLKRSSAVSGLRRLRERFRATGIGIRRALPSGPRVAREEDVMEEDAPRLRDRRERSPRSLLPRREVGGQGRFPSRYLPSRQDKALYSLPYLYEVTNGLCMAVRGKARSPARITLEDAKEAVKFFLDLGITFYDGEELVEEAFALSLKHRWRSVYDMVYLALARALGAKLITAEENLAERGGKDVWLIWDFDEAQYLNKTGTHLGALRGHGRGHHRSASTPLPRKRGPGRAKLHPRERGWAKEVFQYGLKSPSGIATRPCQESLLPRRVMRCRWELQLKFPMELFWLLRAGSHFR